MISILKSHTFLRTFILLALIFTFAGVAYSWTNPSGTPPNNNVAAPINVSSASQIKSGPLQVNGFVNAGSSAFTGNIAVGTTPDTTWKMVASGGAYGIYAEATSGQAIRGYATNGYAGYFANGASTTGGALFAQNGLGYYVYLGYPNSSWGVYTNGNIGAPAFIYNSDQSLKHDIETIPNAVDIIEGLRGVSFKWNDDNRASVGLIAQEVEQVLPELVHTDPVNGLKAVEYGNLVAPLIEAVKEQQKEIEILKQEVSELRNLIETTQ